MLRLSSSALSSLTSCNSRRGLPCGLHSRYMTKSSKSGFQKLLFMGQEGSGGMKHFHAGTAPPEKSASELLLWTTSARKCTETKPACGEEDDDTLCRRDRIEEIFSESEEAEESIKAVR